ncbi:MAG: DUF4175 family protein, partial [Bacteroidota bacterium]
MNNPSSLISELKKYKKKYYTNLLIKGLLISLSLFLILFISLNTLEYFGRFSSLVRGILFFSFLGGMSVVLFFWVILPISHLIEINQQITDEEAARQIGTFFPDIKDKLLNTIQLHKSSAGSDSLLAASIAQRTKGLSIFKFTDAVNYKDNRRYLKYLVIPFIFLLLVFFISPNLFGELFTKSSARIINYNQDYVEPAPFNFLLENEDLKAFKNEDFQVSLHLEGRALPAEVYLVAGERRYKMIKADADQFTYNFSKIQKPTRFYFEAAGFFSAAHNIELIERPSLLSFDAYLNYPAYLGKPDEKWDNIGNLVVPEGTQIQWRFVANQTDELRLIFNESQDTINVKKSNQKRFEYARQVRSSQPYLISLKNKYSLNKEPINYFINVIPDRYPKITLQEYQDTATYNFLSLGGSISDDYGFNRLALFYQISRKDEKGKLKSVNIPISGNQSIQNYYHQLVMDELNLKPGDQLEYFVQVWDNDGVNGPKSVKSSLRSFKVPSREEIREEIDESVQNTENQIDNTIKKAKDLQKDIENL